MGCSSSSGQTKFWFEVSLGSTITCVAPAGTQDRPYLELTINLKTDPQQTLTQRIYLKSAGSGQVEFDPGDSPEVISGTPKIVKVYGVSPSSEVDGTKIEFRLGPDAAVCEEVKLTVFEGVTINFSGTFFSPISNYTGANPGVGPADCENPPTPHNNAIFFTPTNQQRPWTPNPSVTVTSVYAKTPFFQLTNDPIVGAVVRLFNTRFFEDHEPMKDWVMNWDSRIGGNFLSGTTSANTRISTTSPDPTAAEVTQWKTHANSTVVTSNPCYTNLLARLVSEPPNPNGAGLCARMKYKTYATWSNSTLTMSKQSNANTSLAAQAFVIKQGTGKSKVSCVWRYYDWATLVGEVHDGYFETL